MRKPFPVIEVRPLADPSRTGWGIRRRSRTELPPFRSGAVLVFLVDGRYRELPHGGEPRPRERLVVTAREVSLVDMRSRTLVVKLPLPSPRKDKHLYVLVGLRCQVRAPALVAQQRLRDLQSEVLAYFGEDHRLRWQVAEFAGRTVEEVLRVVQGRIAAWFMTKPLVVPGMEIRIADIRLSTH